MDAVSTRGAHQISGRPFIETLFVITPNWLLRSSLCSAAEPCALWETARRKRGGKNKKNTYHQGRLRGGLKIEIRSRTKPERERFFKKIQGVCNQPPIVACWGRDGGPSKELQAGFVSQLGWRDAIGTLMEVYNAARDTPAAADAQ